MIVLLAVLGPALAGCLHATSNLQVDGDKNTVSGKLRLEADVANLDLIVNLDKSPETAYFPNAHTRMAVFEAILGQIPWLPADHEVKTEKVSGKTIYFTEVTYNEVPFQEFSHDDGMTVERDGDTVRFRVSLDAKIYSRGLRADQAEAGMKSATINLSLTMPGKVQKQGTNGTISGSTVTWKINGCGLSGRNCPSELTALSVVSPSPSPSPSLSASPTGAVIVEPPEPKSTLPFLLIGAILVAAAIFSLVLVLLWRARSSGSGKEDEAAPQGDLS